MMQYSRPIEILKMEVVFLLLGVGGGGRFLFFEFASLPERGDS